MNPSVPPIGAKVTPWDPSCIGVISGFLCCTLILVSSLPVHAQSPAPSGTVITIVGTGTAGFSGDGVLATNALIHGPIGLAVGPDDTLYFAEIYNFRIRAVNPVTGVITTVAGNGTAGSSGTSGPATNAQAGAAYLAVDRARNALYFSEDGLAWVRRVNLTNDELSAYAGTTPLDIGFSGDGGPAIEAQFDNVIGIATDGLGSLALADTFNSRIRRIDPTTGIVSTIAGNGDVDHYGDGGPATSAALYDPETVTVDSAGDVFFMDSVYTTNSVRRIDAVTGIITTVAGLGTNYPGTGPATNMNIGTWIGSGGIAVNSAGTILYVAGGINLTPDNGPGLPNQIYRVDLTTGELTVYAGTTEANYSGDGGPALAAAFRAIGGLTVAPGGGLIISDLLNNRIRYIVPDSINLTGDSQQTAFYLPWASSLAGDLVVADNTNLTTINLGSLTSVTGTVDISGNTATGIIDLGSLTNAGVVNIASNTTCGTVNLGSVVSTGSVNINNNPSADVIDLTSLTTATGTVDISGNTTVGVVDLSSLTSAEAVNIADNASCGTVDLGSVTGTGTVNIDNNPSAEVIDLSSLTSATGTVDFSDNKSVGTVDLGSLTDSGSVTIEDNSSADAVNLSSLATVEGTMNISNNTSATNIDLCSLTNVTGDLTITANAPDADIQLCSLSDFGNDTNATTMTVDGDVSVTEGLTIGTNATLAGNATVDGSVTNNGTISPGASPGHLSFTGDLVLHHTSRLLMQLGGYAPGEFDSMTALGNIALDGTLAVSLLDSFLPRMTNGASFTLVTAGTPLAGAFANVADGGSLTTTDGYARYTAHYAGNSVQLADAVIVDSDNDGAPDWWEDRYALNKLDPADATLDADGDGASNLNEFLAGTNPTNSASVFRITSIQPDIGGLRVFWNAVGGHSYVLQTNDGLVGPFSDYGAPVFAPGSGDSITNMLDTGAAADQSTLYFRVRVGP